MKVFLTGATGFLGRALTLALRRDGHTVVAWVRSLEGARAALGDQAELVQAADGARGDADLAAALARCDAVVNLAGEPILARWTDARRAALRASRVELTARLVKALASAEPRPRVLVSGSAVGFYGDRGDERLDETSAPGAGFLPELCRDWERAALDAERHGVRVVLVRTGIVLGLDGGALPQMLPPFRLGLGGRLASGRQYMPWIHLEDWVRAVLLALADERVRGPLNLTAPAPVTNREFTRVLAGVVKRPALVPVPALALKTLFGGAASLLLESQRVEPARLAELGFTHAHPTLEGALRDLLVNGRAGIERLRDPPDVHGSEYLRARPPRYALVATTELGVSTEEAFRFFAAPENLGVLTPRALGFRIASRSGQPATGATIDYRIKVGPVGLAWRTRFEAWQEGQRFVDVQARGPYRGWWHEHRFEARGAETRMHDRVLYSPPLGVLGRLAQRLFIADQLGDIFAQRALAIRLRFGAPQARTPAGLPA
jgi:uncharacterized protein (TIGR01777 family)